MNKNTDKKTDEEGEMFQKKEELKFIYRVWSGYTSYIRSQAVQGRCIN